MWSKAARISPGEELFFLRVPPLPILFSVPVREGEREVSVLLVWRGEPTLLLRLSVLFLSPTTEFRGSRIDFEEDREKLEEVPRPDVLGRDTVLDRGRRIEPYAVFSVTLFLFPIAPSAAVDEVVGSSSAAFAICLSRAPTVGRIFLVSISSLLLTLRMDLRAGDPLAIPGVDVTVELPLRIDFLAAVPAVSALAELPLRKDFLALVPAVIPVEDTTAALALRIDFLAPVPEVMPVLAEAGAALEPGGVWRWRVEGAEGAGVTE